MRTKFFTSFLVAAFLCSAAGASIAYYHTNVAPSQTFNANQFRALFSPPSLPGFGIIAAIRSASPETLRFYLHDSQLMFYAILALTGLFCCAVAFGRAFRLAHAVSVSSEERMQQLHAINIQGLSSGARQQVEPFYGLKGRLTRWFGAIAVLLSSASFLYVYTSLTPLVRRHTFERGRAIAASVAEAAKPQLTNGDATQLRQMLSDQLARNSLAYILVFDGNQAPVAYAGPEVSDPADAVRHGLTVDARGERISRFRNQVVYNMVAGVDNGESGSVQVGVWRSRIEEQARKFLVVIAVLFIAATYGAILGANRLFARVTRPLEELAVSAEALSHGNLETPIAAPAGAPLAQLGDSLEQVRAALKPAINRLKADLDVPVRFTIMGAILRDAWERQNKKSRGGE
ncbi:MAG: HAMP domain-containing protein [Deltaproteobacteria bacterium]|nr:HAMP domain-containing protein [Deltaproteobacteria bacterium]